jgi:hypothetical protein
MFIPANAVREATLEPFKNKIKSTIAVLSTIIPEQIKEAQESGTYYIRVAFTECNDVDTFINIKQAHSNNCYIRTDMDKHTQIAVIAELRAILTSIKYTVKIDEGYVGGYYHTCFIIGWLE